MTENETLLAGYARTEITPRDSVPLDGFGNTTVRMSQWVRDPLYASCVALTDGEDNTVLLFSLDLARLPGAFLDPVRQDIANYYGIPEDHMIFSCIHTQFGPDVKSREDSIRQYLDSLTMILPALAGLALADRRPAELYMGDVETKGMNFVRHYQAQPEDGQPFYFDENEKPAASLIQQRSAHVADADPTMYVLRITRENCKDLVVANFRCHSVLTGNARQKFLTADAIGDFRAAAERRGDLDFVFFQGAAGNITNKSLIFADMTTQDSLVWGDVMTDHLFRALRNMEAVAPAPICTKQVVLEDLELNAVTLGNLAIISAPGELFDTASVFVEENAPFAKVLTLGYANGDEGYLLPEGADEYAKYEAKHTRFAPGISETVAETFVEMLRN